MIGVKLILFIGILSITCSQIDAQAKNWEFMWPNGVLPYDIQTGRFDAVEIAKLKSAMKLWEDFTCVKFIDITNTTIKPQYYINITDGAKCCDKCVSQAGRQPLNKQPQFINLSKRCFKQHTLLHELWHTIGVVHEQKRPDRDDFVTILTDKIIPEKLPNFNKAMDVLSYNLSYGYRSVVHYTKAHWSKDNSITIVTKDPAMQDIIGELLYFDMKDIQLANAMYNCSRNCTKKCNMTNSMVSKDCSCWCGSDDYVAIDCEKKTVVNEIVLPKTTGIRVYKTTNFTDRYYSLEFVDWQAARRRCQDMNGDLFVANTDAKFKLLADDLKAGLAKEYASLIEPGNTDQEKMQKEYELLWIGGSDVNTEGHFVWADGANITTTKWISGQPDNGNGTNEDCIRVNATSSRIDDWNCGKPLRYVCEFSEGSCYDMLSTCKYFASIGKCSTLKYCPYSCGKCAMKGR